MSERERRHAANAMATDAGPAIAVGRVYAYLCVAHIIECAANDSLTESEREITHPSGPSFARTFGDERACRAGDAGRELGNEGKKTRCWPLDKDYNRLVVPSGNLLSPDLEKGSQASARAQNSERVQKPIQAALLDEEAEDGENVIRAGTQRGTTGGCRGEE